tara:strand:+ start:5307 stop:5711 length:405 start_codon:yes stop_codon:yes gene_type:complete
MAKNFLQIKDWSGGMNNRKDPRDLNVNECSFISNMSIDSLGKIKTIGGLYEAKEGSDGTTDLTYYIVSRTANIVGAGGYGAFYFESDHSGDYDANITETKSGTALAIGTSNGNISFVQVKTTEDTPANIPTVPT